LSIYRKILVGVRETPTSAVALKAAAQLAGRLGSKLVALYVSDGTGPAPFSVLEAAERTAAEQEVPIEVEHRRGDPADTIMATSVELGADLLLIGDHGMGEARRFTLGGIPDQVAHHSPIDILVVRTTRRDRPPLPYRNVLIGVDGSFTANQAAARGSDLAAAIGARTTLVYVGDPLIGDIVLRDTAARLGSIDIGREVRRGNPAAEIARQATTGGHDLIVIGNKGMVGSARYLRRVVPNQLAHEAPVDTLICKTVGRSLHALRPGEGAVVEVDGEKVAAFIDNDGTRYTVSARCQHLGCTVGWNSRARTWDCPCHGSRYDHTGAVLNGPTTKPLPSIDLPS
jgi:nucleotide-binding universal stress UspA family protein/nitrite reductase/ring-hydroxylating ferredoxin subunit